MRCIFVRCNRLCSRIDQEINLRCIYFGIYVFGCNNLFVILLLSSYISTQFLTTIEAFILPSEEFLGGWEIIVGYKQYLFYNLLEYQVGFRREICCAGYIPIFITTQLIEFK